MKAVRVHVLHVWYKLWFSSASERPTNEQTLANTKTGRYTEVAMWGLLWFWNDFYIARTLSVLLKTLNLTHLLPQKL